MSRGAFAAISLGAAGALSALGRPHAPFVNEDDPAITVDRAPLQEADDSTGAYAAYPKTMTAQTPGVVVTMHIWGVDAQIRDTVRRLAKAGYAAIAPDLYSRFDAPSGDGVSDISIFRPFAARLNERQLSGDLRAGALRLQQKAPKSKSAVMGFCMGGHLALLQSVDDAGVFHVVAPFYGAPKGIDPKAVAMPVCGSYGERDTSIPADEVRAWAKALTVPNDIKIYSAAGHAFFDDTRNSYVASAAEDAWNRTITFFKENLGPQS